MRKLLLNALVCMSFAPQVLACEGNISDIERNVGENIVLEHYDAESEMNKWGRGVIVAEKCDGYMVVKYTQYQSSTKYNTGIHPYYLYKTDFCTEKSNNQVKICTGQRVVDLTTGTDVEIVGINEDYAIINRGEESSDDLTQVGLSYLISFEDEL